MDGLLQEGLKQEGCLSKAPMVEGSDGDVNKIYNKKPRVTMDIIIFVVRRLSNGLDRMDLVQQ